MQETKGMGTVTAPGGSGATKRHFGEALGASEPKSLEAGSSSSTHCWHCSRGGEDILVFFSHLKQANNPASLAFCQPLCDCGRKHSIMLLGLKSKPAIQSKQREPASFQLYTEPQAHPLQMSRLLEGTHPTSQPASHGSDSQAGKKKKKKVTIIKAFIL